MIKPHLNPSILDAIRKSKGFSRSVTLLIILALVGIATERLIYYTLLDNDVIEAENVVDQLHRVAPQQARQLERLGVQQASISHRSAERAQSNTARFSAAVIDTQTTLARLNDTLSAGQDAQPELATLADLRGQLRAADRAAMAEFAEIAAHIEQHGLPGVIQQRHEAAVSRYRNEIDVLLANLEAIASATNHAERLRLIGITRAQLDSQQHQRSQQPFDPNELPNQSLQPNPDNKPKLDKEAFTTAGLFDNPYQKLAALGDFTFDALPGASDPAYLAETVEVTLSDAVQSQAAALNHDPVAIYHWVRSNIEWLPTWGAMQDADLTLASQRGNATDIASLLIALLRASQIPARYVHGTIDVPAEDFNNWAGGFSKTEAALAFASAGGIPATGLVSGGKISKVRMEHLWVEAAIDYQPSRGAVNRDADSWVQMDPSYKQYDYLQGLDVVAIAGLDPEALAQTFIDSGTIDDSEGWVSGFEASVLENAQTQAQSALENHITNNMTDPTVGDVIGGRKTIVEEFPILPSALPNKIIVTGTRYGAIPAALQHSITLAMASDLFGNPIDGISYPWAQINNQKVTLSFKPATPEDEAALLSLLPEGEITDLSQLPTSIPAYLIHVIPELSLNGTVVKQGAPMALGEELPFAFSVAMLGHAPRAYRSPVIAGSYLSVAVIGGNVSTSQLTDLQNRIQTTKTALESNDPDHIGNLTREDLLGDMFHAGTLGYFAQYLALGHISGLQQNAHLNLAPSAGTYGYVPAVNYLLGIPRAIVSGGVEMDLDRIAVIASVDAGSQQERVNFIMQLGVLSSALEHAIPEQMFTTDPQTPAQAVSAVKALQIATMQGQRTYHITSANQATTLPNLHHDSLTLSEIQAALAVGKEVIVHTDSITVPGWTGAGYIILDPATGDGAYKISGGANGGEIDAEDSISYLQTLSDVLLNYLGVFGSATAAAVSGVISSLQSVISFVDNILSGACPLSVAIIGFILVSAVIGSAMTLVGLSTPGAAVSPLYVFTVLTGFSWIAGQISESFSERCNN